VATPQACKAWVAIGILSGKVLGYGRFGIVAATFVAPPIQKNFFHTHAAQQLHGRVAVVGNQYIFRLHQAANGDPDGFLAEGRRVRANAPGALQRDDFLVEQAGQHHLPIEPGQQVEVIRPARKFADQTTLGGEITGVCNIDLVIGHGTLPTRDGTRGDPSRRV